MDTSYYFVLEPDGVDEGPYRLHEIQRRVDVGLISRQASLCKTGDTTYVPLLDPRFAEVLEPPKRAASGTSPVPVVASTAARGDSTSPKIAPPAVATMPPGFVPPIAMPARDDSFQPLASSADFDVDLDMAFASAAPASAAPAPAPSVPRAPASAPTVVAPAPFAPPASAFGASSPSSFGSSSPAVGASSPSPASSFAQQVASAAAQVGASPAASSAFASAPTMATPPRRPAHRSAPPPPTASSAGLTVPSTFTTSSAGLTVPSIPPQQGFAPPPPGFAPAPAPAYPPPPAPSAPSHAPQGFVPPPPGFASAPQGFASAPSHAPQGFVPPPPGFAPAPTPAATNPGFAPAPSAAHGTPANGSPAVANGASAFANAAASSVSARRNRPFSRSKPQPQPMPQLPAPTSPLPGASFELNDEPTDATARTPLLEASELSDSMSAAPVAQQPLLPAPQYAMQAQPQQPQQMQAQPQPQHHAQLAAQQLGAHAPLALGSMPMSAQPPSLGSPNRKKMIAIAAGAVGVLGIGAVVGLKAMSGSSNGTAKEAIVRVTTPTGAGTGFLIQGPDRYAYVATANHVVDRGDRVLIERDVGADGHTYVEAFPETEVVATDPDADLAIIRIKNVDASRFARLPLASKPSKDERILSYGYPGSSLASKPGLVSKDGKILSLVSFPAYDERYARILRDNAVDGLLISTDVEQGMSGGPTLNSAGQVVGINVTKDRAHVGQNGAVSVVALRELVAKITPAAKVTDPKPEDVVALLEKIQTEYLLLPLDERSRVRETDFVHAGDLPNLRQLVGEVRREERNTDTSFIAKYQLSGQAALGMFFARLPGKLLETYRAPSTMTPLLACELRNERLTSFLGDLTQPTADKPKVSVDSCDELAVRPLAWDLVAATLQWDGKEKKYTVNKLEKMDEDGKVFRASLRISGAPNLVELWLGVDQNKVRLKLFDTVNGLYAIKSPRSVPASAFQGTWSIKRPRVTDSLNKDAEVESSETISISITDDRKVSIRSVVSEKYFTAASGRGGAFRCSGRRTIETGMVQSFTGTLDNGVILAFPEKGAEFVGADGTYCLPSHKADRIVAVKLEGDQLTFIRTDGNAYPETVKLNKDVAAPAPVAPAAPAESK